MSVASVMLGLIAAYLAVGAVVGVGFAVWGAGRIDPRADARGRAWRRFRALLVPGAAALWPLVVVRLAKGAGAPPGASRSMRAERRAHLAVWLVLTPLLLAAVAWAWRERDAAGLRMDGASRATEEVAP